MTQAVDHSTVDINDASVMDGDAVAPLGSMKNALEHRG